MTSKEEQELLNQQQFYQDVEKEARSYLPPDTQPDDSPMDTFGDVYNPQEESPFSAPQAPRDKLEKLRASQQKTGGNGLEELRKSQDALKNLRTLEDPKTRLAALRENKALPQKQLIDNEKFDPNALWTPKTYKEYEAERSKEGTKINPYGMADKSLLNHTAPNKLIKTGYRWLLNKFGSDDVKLEVAERAPTYLGETQVAGRKVAMGVIDKKLNELGEVTVSDYKKRREAEDLWNRKYELQYLNAMDEAMTKAELPSLDEFAQSIKDNPDEFFIGVAQEIINKPELVFIPEIAAARGAYVAGQGVKALGASAKATQVAKFVGGAGGAYASGVTLGTIDRVVDQSASTGEVDAALALEQAQIDGLLGMTIVGGQRAFTKGTTWASNYADSKIKANEFAKEAMDKREVALDQARKASKIEEALQDTATETYADINGNTYTFQIRETYDSITLKDEISQLNGYKSKYAEDAEALSAINAEIKAKTKEMKSKQLEAGEMELLTERVRELESTKAEIGNVKDMAVNWKLAHEKKPKVTQEYMKFTDKDGVEHTLKRVTPEAIRDYNIDIPGFQGIDFTPDGVTKKANNKFVHFFKEHLINTTAPLRNLTTVSPTAQKLIDKLDPRAGKTGRNFVYTLPEDIHYKQAEYMNRSTALQSMLEKRYSKEDAKRIITKHMRGVELSEDPVVLEVAAGYRQLLDDARDYAISRGVAVDKADDYLPRYYNRKSLDTEEARKELANRVSSILKPDGTPKYLYDDVFRSAEDINKNLIKTSDETRYQGTSTEIKPIGNRSWKEVPDALLDDFLEDDLPSNINRYLMNNAQRVEVDTVFGYQGKELKKMIEDIKLEAEANGRFMSEQEIKSLEGLYELAAGVNRQSTFKPFADAALAVQNLTKLPLVTITSALEPTTLLFRLNESSGVKDLVNAYGGFKARKLFGSMSAKEIEKEAAEVGLVHDVAVKERLDAMVGEGLEGLPAKVNNAVMKGFLLHQWTEHTRVVAYEAARNDLVKTIKRIARDPDSPKVDSRRRILMDHNIDPDLAIEWVNNGASVKDPSYTAIKRGAARMVNTAVVNPNKFNKAKWLSNSGSAYRLAGQFKSFGSVFSNDVAKETIDESVRLWNEGRKVQAMSKVGKMLGVVSAMTYWTTYDSAIMFEGEPLGDDSAGEVAYKMVNGVAGMVVPGSSMVAPVYGGRELASALGPTYSDLSNVMKGRTDPKYYAPSWIKAVDKATEDEGL